MKKILFYVIYPAPYRIDLIDIISKNFDSIVFCEKSDGDSRNKDYFAKGNFYCLDTSDGMAKYKEIKKQLGSFDLVFVYDFATKNALSLIFSCIRKRIPYILNGDGVLLYKHGNPIKDIIKKIVIKHAVSHVASGRLAKEYFIKYGAKPSSIYIHNFSALHENQILAYPPDREKKISLRNKYDLPINKIIVLGVGRFIPLKQYDLLIKEWGNTPDNIVFLLVGGGEMENEYRRIITANNIENVIIRGYYPFNELQEIYQACDIFVHPTSYDCWGLVINEAMANALPIVSSNMCVAGLELVDNLVNGYIVDYKDISGFVSKIVELSNDAGKRRKMACDNVAKIKKFTIEYMAEIHLSAISSSFTEENSL